MINLIKEKVFAEPVKCWVNDRVESEWSPRWLIAIADGKYFTVAGFDHNTRVTSIDAFKYGKSTWRYCTLTDQTVPVKKTKKWKTIEDVPPELWGRALIKHKKEQPQLAVVMSPCEIINCEGLLLDELHYLPLGQPLTCEWLPFESEVAE